MLACLTQAPVLMLVQSGLQGKGGISESRLDASPPSGTSQWLQCSMLATL